MFDTDKYFVICVNYLGGCYGSTGPNSIDKITNNIYEDLATIRDNIIASQG